MKRLVVFLAACGQPAPQQPQPPVEDVAGECAKAGANIARVLDVHDSRLADVVASHCKADHWTADARTCVGAAVDHEAALACAHKHMTEEQHELVVKDMRPLLPDMHAHDDPSGSQAEIAERENKDGIELMKAGKYTDASAKFRDAVARVPEPRYFFNLCTSLYQEGKFGEALTSCDAADRNNPDASLKDKLGKLETHIKDDARAQGIQLQSP